MPGLGNISSNNQPLVTFRGKPKEGLTTVAETKALTRTTPNPAFPPKPPGLPFDQALLGSALPLGIRRALDTLSALSLRSDLSDALD